MRMLQIAMVAIAVLLSTGAGDPVVRTDKLSHQLMCTCGCNQLLGECNHVGCPDSPGELATLRSEVDLGKPDREILLAFQDNYGPTSLAAPRFTAFNHLAWIAPYFILTAGIALVAFFVRRWRLRALAVPARPRHFSPAEFSDIRERIRRETET
jgi:cytochrome c-type biogenesis protein CcmH